MVARMEAAHSEDYSAEALVVQAEAADRLARAEELAAERVARAEARVAKAEADIRDVEKRTRHWTMTMLTGSVRWSKRSLNQPPPDL